MKLKIFSVIQTLLVLLPFECAAITSSCSYCNYSGWEFLMEELLTDACPELANCKGQDSGDNKITQEVISEALKCGKQITKDYVRLSNELIKSGVSVDAYPPALAAFFGDDLPPAITKPAETSSILITATKLLEIKACTIQPDTTPNTFLAFLKSQNFIAGPPYCRPFSITCPKTQYRSIDGTCNNLKNPGWGRANGPYTRLITPRYADGIYAMPVAKSGNCLENPRVLSYNIFPDKIILSAELNYFNLQWGQVLAHDVSARVMDQTKSGGIQCCVGNGTDVLPPELRNTKCIPICVPPGDPFYPQRGVKCLNLVRSITAPCEDCSLYYAEQLNAVTSYLDCSILYGSDLATSNDLRTMEGGRLKESRPFKNKPGYLPPAPKSACDLKNPSDPCYRTGDVRVNQTPPLTSLQTLLVREHNRAAELLAKFNPQWNDEKLFQETRKIVIAEFQQITYQEYLPVTFGDYFRYYRISPTSLSSSDYSAKVNAGTLNDFAAAAFRYLHTLIPDRFTLLSANGSSSSYQLRYFYSNPAPLEFYPDAFDDLIRGIATQPAWEDDPYYTVEVTNYLFKSRNDWGLDLVSIDIQRERDHGIAGYNDYRELCGLKRAKTFQDLSGEISLIRIAQLARYYESVDDIDFYVGGVLENDVEGSILGPTFQCVVAEQFYRTRVGDRLFYDNNDPSPFSRDQLRQLKKASASRLICDNTNIDKIQVNAFQLVSSTNPMASCSDYKAIPTVDLSAWKA